MDRAAKWSADEAQALERAGELERAADAYLRGGAVLEAARVLFSARRFERAAHLLLSVAGPPPWSGAAEVRAARAAASCLWHGGDHAGGESILRALGPAPGPATAPAPRAYDRAAVLELARGGQLAEAAAAARVAGDHALAADLFARARHPFEAGVSWHAAGEMAKALTSFLAVPKASAGYRAACMNAIHVAAQLGELSFELHDYVAPFAAAAPTTEPELRCLYLLSTLYQAEGFDDEAIEALERVIAASPTYADAAARLAQLRAGTPDSGLARAAQEDASFWRAARGTIPDDGPVGAAPEQSVAAVAPLASSSAVLTPEPLQPAPAPAAVGDVGPGQLVAGRYQVEAEVGRGGMGTVFRARDLELGEIVALKVFKQVPDQPTLLARFKQELSLCRQLTHANIVRLHDLGAHGVYSFITMELLDGVSLRELRGKLTLPRTIGFLTQLCDGLAAVHGRGIVHRDIKAANVFVTREGVVKIMDFGLAKRADASGATADGLTASGFMAGTPGYMAPEQFTDFGAVTALADLYSLGVLAYELVAGVRPFVHKHTSQLVRLQFSTLPRPLREHEPRVPADLEALVHALLDRDPSRRPESAAQVGARLRALQKI
jgi:eukaryotic-like serine/threonine-protein kinase